LLENDLSKLYENKEQWDLIGRTWKQKQPFWDYWVHVLFSNAQKIDMAKRTACVKMNGIKCKRGKVLSMNLVDNTKNDLFGSMNSRELDGFGQLFITRALQNGGKAVIQNEEIVFECLECGDGYWKTKTGEVDVMSTYSLFSGTIWEKGETGHTLSQIETIAVRIDEDENMLRNCSEIKKVKECVIQDSGAINSLAKAFVDFSGGINVFGKEFLLKLKSGAPFLSLLDEFTQLNLDYGISNKYDYSISNEEITKLENWLKQNSINLFSDFKMFLSLSPSLKAEAQTQSDESLISSSNILNQEDHDIYLGNDAGRKLTTNLPLQFFKSSASLSEWKCIECIEGMYSENGICKLRRKIVENCESLEPNSDGNCLRCIEGYLLAEDKTCSFLSKSSIENCIEFDLDICLKCRLGYNIDASGKNCILLEVENWVDNCYRQTDTYNCIQCRFGHKFNWDQKCYPVDGHGYCWNYKQRDLDGCFSCQPFTFLFNGSDTKSFCSEIKFDDFTGDSGFDDHISTFLDKYVVNGFTEIEYKLKKGQGKPLPYFYLI
jgi:hypothetical protein